MRNVLFIIVLMIAAACGVPPSAEIPTNIIEATSTPIGQAPTLVPTRQLNRETPPPVTPKLESTFHEGNPLQ